MPSCRLSRVELNALSTVLRNAGIDVGTLSLKSMVNSVLGSGAGVGGVLVGAVTSTLSVIVDIVVVLVAAFWFLRDGDLLRHLVIDSLPAAWRPHLDFGLRAFAVVIGGYVRGQVVMAVMVGTMAGVGSLLIGVPFPLVVAVAAGFFELIPLVGPFVGGAVAGLLALSVSLTLVIWVVILFLGIHLLEGYVIAPRLQARYVRLHPVVAFLALFAGIDVAGFLGALIAIPLASLAAVYLQAVLGDVQAARPELFESGAVREQAAVEERRHRELLRKYRIRYREMLRGAIRRLHITV